MRWRRAWDKEGERSGSMRMVEGAQWPKGAKRVVSVCGCGDGRYTEAEKRKGKQQRQRLKL